MIKICFVGVGSIAKRHIKNLYILFEEKGERLRIDALRRKDTVFVGDTGIKIENTYIKIDEMPDDYDVIFITNPTAYHADTLARLHNKAKHFFIEKPVVSLSTLYRLRDIELRNQSIYYVACPLRYSSVIQYIKKNVDCSKVNGVRCISSSYLPEWRPGVDYRKTYSAHDALGGGVSIDLIHEWDYLTYIFGMPNEVSMFKGKVSNLEIDSDDFAIYIAKYSSMTVELHLDYYGRQSIRKVEIFMDEDTLVGDLINGTVTYLKEDKVIDLAEDRDAFQKRELASFIDMIDGKNSICNDIGNAINVLKLTQGEIVRDAE